MRADNTDKICVIRVYLKNVEKFLQKSFVDYIKVVILQH
jgi:hypothetical protein